MRYLRYLFYKDSFLFENQRVMQIIFLDKKKKIKRVPFMSIMKKKLSIKIM